MTWWVVSFARTGPARYLSHLDTARALQRTFARAGVPIALSQGLRPKPRIALPLPLPVGASGLEELAVVEVPGGTAGDAAALRGLRAAAPPGLRPLAVTAVGESHPRPQPREADYACRIDGDAGALLAAVERYASEPQVPYERVSPKGRRRLDLKNYVVRTAADAEEWGVNVRFSVLHREDGAARPQEFVDLLARWAGVEPAMRGLQRLRIAWQGLPPGLDPGDGRRVSP